MDTVTKGIMDLHGGNISVYSEGEGHGTTFALKFPVYRNPINNFLGQRKLSKNFSSHRGAGMRHSPRRVTPNDGMAVFPVGIVPNGTFYLHDDTPAPFYSNSIQGTPRGGMIYPMGSRDSESDKKSSFPPRFIRSFAEDRVTLNDSVEGKSDASERPLRFLLVDDVPLTRKMMRRLLCDRSEGIDEATDGAQAVQMVKTSIEQHSPYDIVLMDHQMPVMDGPAAAAAMRKLGFRGMIVGVSGHVLMEEGKHFLAQGADKVLSKPLVVSDLYNIISGNCTYLIDVVNGHLIHFFSNPNRN